MDPLSKLMDISSRLDHLENIAEWVARQMVHSDSGVSQSGTLICVLADEIRESIYEVARDIEHQEVVNELEDEPIH